MDARQNPKAPIAQDLPPKGGFGEISYKRNVPVVCYVGLLRLIEAHPSHSAARRELLSSSVLG